MPSGGAYSFFSDFKVQHPRLALPLAVAAIFVGHLTYSNRHLVTHMAMESSSKEDNDDASNKNAAMPEQYRQTRQNGVYPRHPKQAGLSSKVSSVKASSFVETHEQVFLNFHNSSFTNTMQLEESRPAKKHPLTGKFIHTSKSREDAGKADGKDYQTMNFGPTTAPVTDIFFDFDGTLTARTYRVFEYAAPPLAALKGFRVPAIFAKQDPKTGAWTPGNFFEEDSSGNPSAEYPESLKDLAWPAEFLPFVKSVLGDRITDIPRLTDAITYPGEWAKFKPDGYKEPTPEQLSAENLITYEEFDLLMEAAVKNGWLDHLKGEFEGERSVFGTPETRKQLTDALKALQGMGINIHLLTANMNPRTQIAMLERFCPEWDGIFSKSNFWDLSGSTEMARVLRRKTLFDHEKDEATGKYPGDHKDHDPEVALMEEWYDNWSLIYRTFTKGHPAMTEYAKQFFTVEMRFSKCEYIKSFEKEAGGGVLVDDNFAKNIYDCYELGASTHLHGKYIQPDPDGVVQTTEYMKTLARGVSQRADDDADEELDEEHSDDLLHRKGVSQRAEDDSGRSSSIAANRSTTPCSTSLTCSALITLMALLTFLDELKSSKASVEEHKSNDDQCGF